jgi:hypothetical protein
MSSRRRTFALWQPIYAAHRIATFPIRMIGTQKVPAIRGYGHVGLRGSGQLAEKFRDADMLGFMCGARNKVTVLDADTTEERVLADALTRHGATPLIVRTASGKWHAYYKHNGERRRIRPWDDRPIDVLGSNGFVVVPQSKIADGHYQIVQGRLDDLDRLPTMRLAETDDMPPELPNSASPLRGMREHDGRNRALFLAIAPTANDIHGAGGTRDAQLDVALSHNKECTEPMTTNEVSKVVDSVWRLTCKDRNWVGQSDRRQRELSSFSADPDAFYLLEYLRVTAGAEATFWIANGVADIFGWSRKRFADARSRIIELGYVKQIKRPWHGQPACYTWPER